MVFSPVIGRDEFLQLLAQFVEEVGIDETQQDEENSGDRRAYDAANLAKGTEFVGDGRSRAGYDKGGDDDDAGR